MPTGFRRIYERRIQNETAQRSSIWRVQETTGRLKGIDCYCVMGVCCELTGIGRWELDDCEDGIYYRYVVGKNKGGWAGPPEEVLKVMGIDDEIENELMKLNDSRDLSFTELADYIETNL